MKQLDPSLIIGKKFGRLTIVGRTNNDIGRKYYIGSCDCGNKHEKLNSTDLLTGKVVGCGAKCPLRINIPPEPPITDPLKHNGEKYGSLTIQSVTNERVGGKIRYLCLCDCGRNKLATISCLKNGSVKSCGKCQRSTIPIELTIGQRFGMLTVVSKADNIGTKTAWNTLCDCGKGHKVKTAQLIKGRCKSCGCQLNYNKVNLIGQTFGRLFVVDRVAGQKEGDSTHAYYLCKCSCGEQIFVPCSRLKRGVTKSCGCLQKELVSARMKLSVGENNNAWKGGGSMTIRNNPQYKAWKKSIYKAGSKTCDICGDTKRIEAHHLDAIVKHPEKIYDIDNGVCLCNQCHKIFHSIYGSGDNTREQYIDFKNKVINGTF